MIGQETREVERKVITILKVLGDSLEPVGARVIAYRLKDYGIYLSERAVRYHLKLMDERGFTYRIGRRDGRLITQQGIQELNNALVDDRLGSVMTKIEKLTYQSSFIPEKYAGGVPVNVSLFLKERFGEAREVMEEIFRADIGISNSVAIASGGERLGEVIVPPDKIGLATISQILLTSALLKAGIPVDHKFGGVLEIRDHKPYRFIDIIGYANTSLDPATVFIASSMTSVSKVAKEGIGKILASFCEIPALARSEAEAVMKELEATGMRGVLMIGGISEPTCGLTVAANKVGIVLNDGLNPVAAAVEAGIEVVNHVMSTVIYIEELGNFAHLKDR